MSYGYSPPIWEQKELRRQSLGRRKSWMESVPRTGLCFGGKHPSDAELHTKQNHDYVGEEGEQD